MSGGFSHESPVNQSVEYYTPRYIFDGLGARFSIDVASPAAGPLPWIPADRFYTPKENGLAQPWEGLIWCNPPYGKETEYWMSKMSRHNSGIALVFARTDTGWFQETAKNASGILLIAGRIRFVNREHKSYGSPGAPSMLIGWGEDARKILSRSNLGLFYGAD